MTDCCAVECDVCTENYKKSLRKSQLKSKIIVDCLPGKCIIKRSKNDNCGLRKRTSAVSQRPNNKRRHEKHKSLGMYCVYAI